ncbi:hypothetical protein M8C17_01560 [Micromonospora sp. RHAY321]|uniref:hypothetical protein n=1 Tax=Micromonospora sp. RHAY321 TaxID=2944807 RepID=UPI00207D41D7|nr:hypothetical protein [Micromonospora sp. RHAY321]MCO1593848.1 hypothetical protein [Micromonospora sp. RHAY321]
MAITATLFEVEPAGNGAKPSSGPGLSGSNGISPAIALFGAEDYLRMYLFVRDRLPGLGL